MSPIPVAHAYLVRGFDLRQESHETRDSILPGYKPSHTHIPCLIESMYESRHGSACTLQEGGRAGGRDGGQGEMGARGEQEGREMGAGLTDWGSLTSSPGAGTTTWTEVPTVWLRQTQA